MSARTASKRRKTVRTVASIGLVLAIAASIAFIIPASFMLYVEREQAKPQTAVTPFPVTVNPQTKTITENSEVNAFLESPGSPLEAAVGGVRGIAMRLFVQFAASLTDSPWYRALAATDSQVVVITPGMRKEQAALVFGNALHWDSAQKELFLTKGPYAVLPFPEGSFSPGSYLVSDGMTPVQVQQMVNDRFSGTVLAHYSATTASIVPINEALTVASLIQREASGRDDMRLISGIIWNRLFAGMPLQIDATLQYAKANEEGQGSWWPRVYQAYEKIVSPYNTYLHTGLPPTPIAEPSVAAILAALNPIDTPCYYYFHDPSGQIHCSDTYSEHLSQIRQFH